MKQSFGDQRQAHDQRRCTETARPGAKHDQQPPPVSHLPEKRRDGVHPSLRPRTPSAARLATISSSPYHQRNCPSSRSFAAASSLRAADAFNLEIPAWNVSAVILPGSDSRGSTLTAIRRLAGAGRLTTPGIAATCSSPTRYSVRDVRWDAR